MWYLFIVCLIFVFENVDVITPPLTLNYDLTVS